MLKNNEICNALKCLKPSGLIDWINCRLCNNWVHFKRANLSRTEARNLDITGKGQSKILAFIKIFAPGSKHQRKMNLSFLVHRSAQNHKHFDHISGTQLALPAEVGGRGVSSASLLALSAFLASASGASDFLTTILILGKHSKMFRLQKRLRNG